MNTDQSTIPELIAELSKRLSERGAWAEVDNLRQRTTAERVGRLTVASVAQETGIPAELIMGRGRSARVYKARAVAMTAMYQAGYSSPEIGKFFGRDHGAVLHAVKRVKQEG